MVFLKLSACCLHFIIKTDKNGTSFSTNAGITFSANAYILYNTEQAFRRTFFSTKHLLRDASNFCFPLFIGKTKCFKKRMLIVNQRDIYRGCEMI